MSCGRLRMHSQDEDDVPATQPVMSVLLEGVVAYVEVRSGHDNRSRGVKAHLRNLGATVVDKVTQNVTHVVFNEGLPSTYKKAKKFGCHLVSVLWIEACKEALTKVGEAGYPPIGQQIYENPDSLKNFKKMKSMQPDFDDDVSEMKVNKIRKKIRRRQAKAMLVPDIVLPDENSGVSVGQNSLQNQRKKAASKQTIQVANEVQKRVKFTSSKRKAQEITNVVNQSGHLIDKAEVQDSVALSNNVENINAVGLGQSSQESTSSSSVIYCGHIVEGGQLVKNLKKPSKPLDNIPISRADFVEGLNKIVRSLSEDKQPKTYAMSPWRRKSVGAPPVNGAKRILSLNQISPRKSPRLNSSFKQHCDSPRRSPRHVPLVMQKPKETSTKTVYSSASAVVARKRRVAPLPSSPGEDFMLLSQEPGDMPPIDDLARIQRGSSVASDGRVPISQVIKSYNAVAKEQVQSLGPRSQSASSFSVTRLHNNNTLKSASSRPHNLKSSGEEPYVNLGDVPCNGHVVSCQNDCPSEEESTASSCSTKVLINGLSYEKVNKMAHSDLLPSSEETDYVDCVSNDVDQQTGPTYEREASPILGIKKPRTRRPLKKQSFKDKVSASAGSSSSPAASVIREVSVNEKRKSLTPIEFINNFFLPRFMLASGTHKESFLVEETPDMECAERNVPDDSVVPPKPDECILQNENKIVTSPTQSLAKSVISWVKERCELPLLAACSSKVAQSPIPEKIPVISCKHKTPEKEDDSRVNDSAKVCIDSVPTACSSESNAVLTSEKAAHQFSPIRSSQKLQAKIPDKTADPRKKLKRNIREAACNANTPSVQAIENPEDRGITKKYGTRFRLKVSVTNNDENPCRQKKLCPPKPPTVRNLQKLDEGHSSSGYESSHSQGSDKGGEVKISASNKRSNQEPIGSTSYQPSGKNFQDPFPTIKGNPKKRSEMYEGSETSITSAGEKTQNVLVTTRGRQKRCLSLPHLDSRKKQKLNGASPRNSVHLKPTSSSRVDTRGSLKARSHSDLSGDGSTSSPRKSLNIAKKRMAKSLTRKSQTDAPKVIVCTFLTASEQNGIETAGESLQNWKLEKKVTSHTTHVINSGPKRTVNMLKGMVRGCWLVDQKWMLDSSKAGCWLEEEKYELKSFSPAVMQSRMRRQALGKQFRHTLFSKAGPIYVSPEIVSPPAKDIRELLELSGANLTSAKSAKFVVVEDLSKNGVPHCVTPLWVLDCITKNLILPVSDVVRTSR